MTASADDEPIPFVVVDNPAPAAVTAEQIAAAIAIGASWEGVAVRHMLDEIATAGAVITGRVASGTGKPAFLCTWHAVVVLGPPPRPDVDV